jgi:hypothetical protein
MMRRLFVLAALAAAALSVFAGSSSARTIRKCKPNVQPGLEVVGRTTVIIYCGSATVNVKFGGKTYKFANGACYKAAGSLNVGVGKYTTISHAPLYQALYLVAPAPQDGTYKLGVLSVQFKGKSLDASHMKMIVKGKRSNGSFSGTFVKGGPKFTGTFSCK